MGKPLLTLRHLPGTRSTRVMPMKHSAPLLLAAAAASLSCACMLRIVLTILRRNDCTSDSVEFGLSCPMITESVGFDWMNAWKLFSAFQIVMAFTR